MEGRASRSWLDFSSHVSALSRYGIANWCYEVSEMLMLLHSRWHQSCEVVYLTNGEL